MTKIAILIMIHKYTWQQKKLITHLAKDFDVFVHIDKRTDIKPTEVKACGKKVKVYKRHKVYWGHSSQIFTTLFLLEEAYKIGYDRYVLISGEDVPLKSNAKILAFFTNNIKEYFEYAKLPVKWWGGNGGLNRVDYFYAKNLNRGKNNLLELITKVLNKPIYLILRSFMKVFNLKRRLPITYYGGSQWWNLTQNCVSQIFKYLKANPRFLSKFKYTSCADEIFFQTLILNFVKSVNCENYNLRHIDWTTGASSPHIFTMEDISKLEADTKALFARKFDCKIDGEIIEECFKRVES